MQEQQPTSEATSEPVQQQIPIPENQQPTPTQPAPNPEIEKILQQNKELKERLAKIDAEKEEQRQAELKKKGEFDTLLKEANGKIEAMESRHDYLSKVEQQRREKLLAKLGDNPERFENLDVFQLETVVEQIESARKEASGSTSPGVVKPSQPNLSPNSGMTPEEKARALGLIK